MVLVVCSLVFAPESAGKRVQCPVNRTPPSSSRLPSTKERQQTGHWPPARLRKGTRKGPLPSTPRTLPGVALAIPSPTNGTRTHLTCSIAGVHRRLCPAGVCARQDSDVCALCAAHQARRKDRTKPHSSAADGRHMSGCWPRGGQERIQASRTVLFLIQSVWAPELRSVVGERVGCFARGGEGDAHMGCECLIRDVVW